MSFNYKFSRRVIKTKNLSWFRTWIIVRSISSAGPPPTPTSEHLRTMKQKLTIKPCLCTFLFAKFIKSLLRNSKTVSRMYIKCFKFLLTDHERKKEVWIRIGSKRITLNTYKRFNCYECEVHFKQSRSKLKIKGTTITILPCK